jgi:Fic family protein
MIDLKKVNGILNKEHIQTSLNQTIETISKLNGIYKLIPNSIVILNLLTLSEAKESSAIENVATTYDELYSEIAKADEQYPNAKEVIKYRRVLLSSMNKIKESSVLTSSLINNVHDEIFSEIKGIRKFDGKHKTIIRDNKTGEIIYTPPQEHSEILSELDKLFHYIWKKDDLHPFIKVAIVHLYFEMIHPYNDGNGRTGRILNILYLISTKKLETPCLYLSKYIIDNKREYYELLRKCNKDEQVIPKLVSFFLRCIETTGKMTIHIIEEIQDLINDTKKMVHTKLPKIYSSELIDCIFTEMYTKPMHLVKKLNIDRKTADKYLNNLVNLGLMKKTKRGRSVLYINLKMYTLLDLIDGKIH